MTVDRAEVSRRRESPDRRPTRAAWLLALAAWLVFSAALGLLYAAIPPSADQALYDYIGWRIVEGATPYVDVAELNWPGGMLLHAAATGLFGSSLYTWRIFDYLYLLATLALVFWVVRALLDRRTAAVAVVLYQVLYVTGGVWFSGQRDIMAAPFLLLAAFAATRGLDRASWRWAMLAGGAIAPAIILKPTLGAMAALLGAQALWAWRVGRGVVSGPAVTAEPAAGSDGGPQRSRINLGRFLSHVGGLAAGLLAGLGVFALVAVVWGFVDAWWVLCCQFNRAVYTQDAVSLQALAHRVLAYAVPSWHWLLVTAAVGFVMLVKQRGGRLAWVATALLATTFISVVVQQKGFGYHLGPAVLGLALLSSGLLSWCVVSMAVRPLRPASWRVWAAGAVLLVIVAGLCSKLHRELRGPARWYAGDVSRATLLEDYLGGDPGVTMTDVVHAAHYLDAHTTADQTVLFWGRSVFTLYLARRASPTRFVNAYMLWAAGPEFAGSRTWTREFERDLTERPPAFIILTRRPGGRHVWIEEGAASVDLLLGILAREYRKVVQFGSLELYRRMDSRAYAAGVN